MELETKIPKFFYLLRCLALTRTQPNSFPGNSSLDHKRTGMPQTFAYQVMFLNASGP